jgi:hypothetical protein
MGNRFAYFDDLLQDCLKAVYDAQIPEEHHGVVIAALIQSDGLNGLRKTLLQIEANRRTA